MTLFHLHTMVNSACKLSKQKENVSHCDHTTGRSTNHTHTYTNLYDHLKNFMKLELESRTKIEHRNS